MDIPSAILNFINTEAWAIDLRFGMHELSSFVLQKEYGLQAKTKSEIVNLKAENYVAGSGYGSQMTGKEIAVIPLIGTMFTEDQYCGPVGVRTLTKELYNAYENPNVIGVLIEGSTGGGQVSAAKLLNSAIIEKNKPVVVHAQQLASGGVWGTINADERVGDLGSIFGSVGAFYSIDKKMVQYFVDNIDDIYAEQSEDKNYGIRQYLAGNKAPLQNEVNSVAKEFINLVKPHLTGTEEQNDLVLKGGMFDDKFSKKVGLIDRIGTRNVAINRILELSKYYK